MVALGRAQPLPVVSEARGIQIVKAEALQYPMIPRHFVRVGKHPAHFGIGAAIIAFVATTVCMAKWISTDIDRALCARGARDTNHEKRGASDFGDFDVPRLQQVEAHLTTIVETVPKRLLITRDLLRGQSVQARGARLFAHTQHHHATFRIGHGTVRLPKAPRKTAARGFELPVSRLTDLSRFQNAIE